MKTQETALPVAVQLYSLRTLPGSFDETLAQVAAAGFSTVETVGDHGCTATEMATLLAKHRLRVIASHLQLEALRDNLADVIAFNQAIGNDTLVAPYIPALVGEKRARVFQATGQLLGELGRRCQAAGMQLLYHNHHWEMVELNGKLALDWLFDSAGDSLGFEPDLAWITFGGVDPVVLLQRYRGRCPRVHLKDLAPQGERPEDQVMDGAVMADVGYGTLAWPRLLPATRDAGATWYIVEHDNPRDPVASVSRSLAYLRQQLPGILNL
ncbi:MAG TPA: sugar phosphate isomerase/epimerase [Anaerolineae bacterium]|nr:sugar phosphate isomerase/epimerase [Anaerolineae bacterium]HMR62845.1 sugar phosphate isomerase/epimerase [Anaerolineae bacterium]